MDMDIINAFTYVQEHNLHAESNKLANKVGNIYIACWMLYKNIPQTKKILQYVKRL